MKNDRIEPASPEIEALLASERPTGAASPYLRRRALGRAHAVVAGNRPARESRRGFWHWRLTVVTGATVLLTALSAAAFVLLKKDTPVTAPPESEQVQATAHSKTVARKAAVVPPALEPPTTVGSPIAVGSMGSEVPSPATRPTKQRTATAHLIATRAERPRTAAAAPPATVLAENYARELKVLQPAREAVTRGDFAEALLAITNHERLFPDGQLREEREALRVRSLIGLHRSGEAHDVALTFHKRYPRSVLLSPMKDALERSP